MELAGVPLGIDALGDAVALSITSVVRVNGASCDHVTVTLDHEGTTRTFDTSFKELDALVDGLGGPAEAAKALVMLWAAYRRGQTRTVIGVSIA